MAVSPAWPLTEHQDPLGHSDFLCRSVQSQVCALPATRAAVPFTHPWKDIQGSWIHSSKEALITTRMIMSYKSRIHKSKHICFQGSLVNISVYDTQVQGGYAS